MVGNLSGCIWWIKDAETAVYSVESRRDLLERNADYRTKLRSAGVTPPQQIMKQAAGSRITVKYILKIWYGYVNTM